MQQQIYEQAAGTARHALGPALFAAARREGQAMSQEQAVAYALERAGSGAGMPDPAH